MKVSLTNQESENLFFNALCNGLHYVSSYGLELDFNETEYQNNRKPNDSFEDVLMSMLRNGCTLTLNDIECEGEYTSTISLNDVHEKVSLTPTNHLMAAINENGDADTADVIIQSVFFGEIIFG
jgi:hypothetical protein